MNQIEQYIEDINNLGFREKLNLNSKETAKAIGVSPSTIETWRKQNIGIKGYIEVGGRILYPKRKIAEFLARS